MSLRAPNDRLLSLDALRGFDMLWIVGLGDVFTAVMRLLNAPEWLVDQMDHAEWAGFHYYDLIMPMFVFVMGAAIPLAASKHLEGGETKRTLYLRLLRRVLILALLGVFYNAAGEFMDPNVQHHGMRYASVLGFIGVAYGFAMLIVLNCRVRAQVAWMAGIALVYAAVIAFIPVPGLKVAGGIGGPEGLPSAFVDQHCLPGTLFNGQWDPEGLLPMASGVSLALMGALAGQWLRRMDKSGQTKALGLWVAGFACVIIGLAWNWRLPIVKNVWTPSFVAYAGGWSLLHLAVFYWLMDVRGWRWLGFPFAVVGVNAILIYLLENLGIARPIAFVLGGSAQWVGPLWGDLIVACGVLIVEWLLLWCLWRKRWFLKV